jgi:hypothetical protein
LKPVWHLQLPSRTCTYNAPPQCRAARHAQRCWEGYKKQKAAVAGLPPIISLLGVASPTWSLLTVVMVLRARDRATALRVQHDVLLGEASKLQKSKSLPTPRPFGGLRIRILPGWRCGPGVVILNLKNGTHMQTCVAPVGRCELGAVGVAVPTWLLCGTERQISSASPDAAADGSCGARARGGFSQPDTCGSDRPVADSQRVTTMPRARYALRHWEGKKIWLQ